ncbi:MAG: HGxxPAAW family protein [Marmoricola sp.]
MSDNHGNTPAAWTGVTIGLLAFVVGGIGLMIASMTTFWIGVVLAPIAILVWVVMERMGYGAPH